MVGCAFGKCMEKWSDLFAFNKIMKKIEWWEMQREMINSKCLLLYKGGMAKPKKALVKNVPNKKK